MNGTQRVFVARLSGLPVYDPNGDQVGKVRDVVVALRFAAAAAGLKCTRLGGSMAAPRRAEVEALLATR